MHGLDIDRQRLDHQPHAWRLTMRGELDASTAGWLKETTDVVIDHGALLVVLDLADVSFLDSSGLREIVAAQARLEARGGRLVCSGLSAAASRVLDLTGMLERLRPPDDA